MLPDPYEKHEEMNGFDVDERLLLFPLLCSDIFSFVFHWLQAWAYWRSAPEHVKLGVLQKLQTSSCMEGTDLYDRGKLFCNSIHKLWPEGGPRPKISWAYKELMQMLNPEKKAVNCVLWKRDFLWDQLAICDFENQPEEVQWEVVGAVQKAIATKEFIGMQSAERVEWFVRKLKLAAAEHAAAQSDTR